MIFSLKKFSTSIEWNLVMNDRKLRTSITYHMNSEKESTTFCRGLSFFLSLLTQQEMYLNVTLLKKEFYAWWNDLAESIFGMEKLKYNLFSFFISCNLIFPQWMPWSMPTYTSTTKGKIRINMGYFVKHKVLHFWRVRPYLQRMGL